MNWFLAVAGLVEYWIARIAIAAVAAFPSLSNVIARLLDILVPRLRRIANRNLKMAGFSNPNEIADGIFLSIARLLRTFARLPRLTPQNISELIHYEGLDNFQNALARGRGVLVSTAHLGNWELSAFAHAWMTAPMHIVVRPIDNPRIDALVERYRGLSGNHIIEKKDAARGILKALKSGAGVGILIDQNTTLDQGVFIEFFGMKACAGTAFAKLAHHSGAPVVPGFALWSAQEQRYILRFYPEIPLSGDVAEDTQRIQSQLESVIRQYPDQWLWIHRRWKTRPPGEPPLY
ncbi:MAG TPA: lysophospholipid acyltransferase family protein [Bryobacteraceae bacterium]|nr:lysophospholipid acyltransferase family protein [Bryobacteraceae bacterium]